MGPLLLPHRLVMRDDVATPAARPDELPALRARRDLVIAEIQLTEALIAGRPPEIVVEWERVEVTPVRQR